MNKIYIIGLGPGNIKTLTLEAVEKMSSGNRNYLRTKNHPTVSYLEDKNIEYESFDEIYKRAENFEEVYLNIVDSLIDKARKYGEINYIVPGNPMVAENSVKDLVNREIEDIEVEIISGISFIEPMLELVKKDPVAGLQIVDGINLREEDLNLNMDTIITQVYSKMLLSEIKLKLSEVYGDEYEVYFIKDAGMDSEYLKILPIYQLDREMEPNLLTSLYIPKMEELTGRTFYSFNDILNIMEILRSSEGCPWDMKQTHKSIREAMIEEAYEAVDAIDSEDIDNLVEELGDVLLQVVFHSQIGKEEASFNIYEVLSSLGEKLIYRHPHVFSNKKVEKADDIVYNWDVLKYEKRDLKTYSEKFKDIKGLPSLLTSYKLQAKAAEIGFDWDSIEGPLDKILEEYEEVKEAIFKENIDDIESEMGDLLFSVVNLSRFFKVNPEVALNRTINKFITRFEHMEEMSKNQDLKDLSLMELDNLWNQAKLK